MFTYFIHPVTLSSMDNVLRMRMAEGAAGYGIYVMVLESLRAAAGYRIKNDPAVIAWSIHEPDTELLSRILGSYDLFEFSEDGYISSPWLCAAMAQHDEKRAKLSAAGKKSAEKKAAAVNQVATTLGGGLQPAPNHVDDLSQQTKEINNKNKKNPPSQPLAHVEGVGGYFSDEMISQIGKDKSGVADADRCRSSLPADKDHNPEIILSRVSDYGLTYNQVMALYNVTEGCRIGGARTMALLAAFRHCKETNFKPMYSYEYLMSRIKESGKS